MLHDMTITYETLLTIDTPDSLLLEDFCQDACLLNFHGYIIFHTTNLDRRNRILAHSMYLVPITLGRLLDEQRHNLFDRISLTKFLM